MLQHSSQPHSNTEPNETIWGKSQLLKSVWLVIENNRVKVV